MSASSEKTIIERASATFGGLGGRSLWSVADQLASSLSNFLLFGSIARVESLDELGAFTLAYSVFYLFLGSSRAASSEPLLIRYSGDRLDFREGIAAGAGVALLFGVLGASVLGLLGVVLQSARSSFWLLAVLAPALLLQDCFRYAFLAQRKPKRAFLNDVLWLGVQLISYIFLFVAGTARFNSLLISWGLSGSIAAFIGMRQLSTAPNILGAVRWLRRHRDLVPRFVGEFWAHAGAGQGITYGVAVVAGSSALGMLRAAQVMLGPITMLFMGTTSVLIPESVRLHGTRHQHARTILPVVGTMLGVISLVWAGILLLVPPSVGSSILADNWAAGRKLLVPLGISTALSAISLGPLIGLRGLEAAKHSYRARIFTAISHILGAIAGSAMQGAYGAAVGLAIANALSIPIWWASYSSARRKRQSRDQEEVPGEEVPISFH